MKRVYLLFAVVAAQLLWLGWNYADRTREMAESPVIHIECSDYDPRDLFRGDYVSIQTRQEVPLELAGASLYWDNTHFSRDYTNWESGKKEDVVVPITNPLPPRPRPEGEAIDIGPLSEMLDSVRVAVYWKTGADGLHHVNRVEAPGSVADLPVGNEVRSLMWCRVDRSFEQETKDEKVVSVTQEVKLTLSFTRRPWKTMRFYVEEGTGDIRRLWLNEIEGKDNVPFDKVRRTVDIVLRENAPAVPRMLYLNGVPYPEAVEQMRDRTFDWSPPVRAEGEDIVTK